MMHTTMKKTLLIMAACVVSIAMFATDLTGKRIYINPGHGSWGPNDRPNATIPYPNLESTGMPDTCGFYESNTNLWKCLELRDRLEAAGAFVMMSHTQAGPWPYEKVDGEYPDYTYEHYKSLPDYEKYNRPLLDIADEAEANNMDYFISVHSNAATDGNTVNYMAYFYRGNTDGTHVVPGAIDRCKRSWYHAFECRSMDGLEPTNYDTRDPETSKHILADIDFYGSSYDATLPSSGKTYTGYLGVLHHGVPGFLVEGYFHTYQPARHRALNPDYCKQEGIRYYRGIVDFYGAEPDTKGYILGTVKDEHNPFTHELYKYAANTNDQYAPLNGAVVTLSKENGEVVATYTVDNNYNGLFYFPDLEPGTYKLMATAEGYKPLHRKYQTIEVVANATSYPFLFLEEEGYIDPSANFQDYPNPDQPAYAAVPEQFNMKQNDPKDFTASIKGTIKRTIQHADSVFYLTHEENGTAHIYVLNNTTGKLDTISTVGIVPVDTTNPGDHLALSDIAITCDNKLVGVNYTRCNYQDDAVESGYKRGTTRFYIWDDFYADPVEWFTSQFSSNSFKSDQGYTMAISGMSDNCTILTTGVHRYGNGARFTIFNVANSMLASEAYFGYQLGSGLSDATTDETAVFDEAVDGADFRLTLSPLGEKKDFIMDAEKMAPVEFKTAGPNEDPVVLGEFDSTLIGVKYQGASYFKYAGKSLMVTPYEDAEGNVAGIKLFDITEGLDKAVLVLTQGTTLAAPVAAVHASAGAYVNGAVLNLYLYADSKVYSYTTDGVQQPIVARVGAYDLQLANNTTDSTYTFTFQATENAVSSAIVFYQDGKEVGEVAMPTPAVKGENTVVVKYNELPGYSGTPTTWAVRVSGKPVPGMGLVSDYMDTTLLTKPFGVVDTHPESDYFGRYYVMNATNSMGLYIYDQAFTQLNSTPYACIDGSAWDAPRRLAVASDGTIFAAEYSDGNSGIFVIDPADPTKVSQFFAGTRDAAGVISNNSVNVGASTAGISIYKEGAESKLIVYNEDFGTSLGNILIYNIGQADGSIAKVWEGAPSEIYGKGSNLAGLVNKNGQPILTDYGFFCSTLRYSGGNNSYATSARYYNFNEECEFSTHYDAYVNYVNGSNDGALALSNDHKYLVLPDDNNQFVVFECAWDEAGKLTVKYVESFKHNLGPIHQLSFDYAGHLVATAKGHISLFTMPTADNTTIVPAKKALVVEKPFSGKVEGVELDQQELALIKGETATLVASVKPAVAPNKDVVWTSSNEAAATVADGVVTAVATGEAVIKVTTVEGEFVAECKVVVTNPMKTITLDKQELTILVSQQATLVATITPADADEKTILWSSSNSSVASVVNGEVKALKVGKATIYAKNVEGTIADSCVVTVDPIAVTGITLDATELTLNVSQTDTLIATIAPEDATDKSVTWASDNEQVATVANGVVTAVAAGTANITVTTTDGGFKATCVVTVKQPVTGVTLDTTALTLDVPQTATLKATVAPEDATDKSVTWASDNETVATVVDGIVTAVAEGTANITVTTTDGGFKATCVVTVRIVDGVMNIQVLDINAPMYDVLGRQVDKNYRGIVIQNGYKFLLQ